MNYFYRQWITMKKQKQKYGPEYPQQHYAEKMAIEIGDSLSKFVEVLHREFTALKFKGICFNSISVTFGTGNGSTGNQLHVTIHSEATGKIQTQYGEKDEDSRLFFIGGRDWIEWTFGLIYWWHQELVTNHKKLLKDPEPLTLFKP